MEEHARNMVLVLRGRTKVDHLLLLLLFLLGLVLAIFALALLLLLRLRLAIVAEASARTDGSHLRNGRRRQIFANLSEDSVIVGEVPKAREENGREFLL